MNVHKRCQKNVANNCGINPRQIALLLQQIGISDNNTANSSSNINPIPVVPPKSNAKQVCKKLNIKTKIY
jgi:novel protein kinase C epsilon type